MSQVFAGKKHNFSPQSWAKIILSFGTEGVLLNTCMHRRTLVKGIRRRVR